VIPEEESNALADFVKVHAARATCALAKVEVIRAVRPYGDPHVRAAREMFNAMILLPLENTLLDAAADLAAANLRTLDAIHLAAAQTLGSDLTALVTYDDRMTQAAEQLSIRVASPGR
jgi:predicted nucleic acid-binding protein